MVFKPRQVQDVRIVKFKEILAIHIMIKLEFPQLELLAIEILLFD